MSDASADTADRDRPSGAGTWKKISLVVSGLVWGWIVISAVLAVLKAPVYSGEPTGKAIYLILMFAGGFLLAVMTYGALMLLNLAASSAVRLWRKVQSNQ